MRARRCYYMGYASEVTSAGVLGTRVSRVPPLTYSLYDVYTYTDRASFLLAFFRTDVIIVVAHFSISLINPQARGSVSPWVIARL